MKIINEKESKIFVMISESHCQSPPSQKSYSLYLFIYLNSHKRTVASEPERGTGILGYIITLP